MSNELDELGEVKDLSLIINTMTEEQKIAYINALQAKIKTEEEDESVKKINMNFRTNGVNIESIIKYGEVEQLSQLQFKRIFNTASLAVAYTLYKLTDVHKRMDKAGIHRVFLFKTTTYNKEYEVRNFDELKARLYDVFATEYDYFKATYSKAPARLEQGEFNRAMVTYLNEYIDNVLSSARNRIKYDGSTTFEEAIQYYIRLIKYINPNQSEDQIRLDAYMMYYAVGSIKRSINRHPDKPSRPKMIYFYGSQDAGKSTLARKLFDPLSEYNVYITAKLNIANDSTWSGIASSPVVYFDEFAKVGAKDKSEMNAFKAMITFSDLAYRKLHSHDHGSVNPRCTVFGSSNQPLSSMITDSTGYRRFWQISFTRQVTVSEWKQMKAENFFEKLYTVVDEDTYEDHYKDFDSVIKEKQESSRADVGVLTEFFTYYDIQQKDDADADGHIINHKDLRKMFINWVREKEKTQEASTMGIIESKDVTDASANKKFTASVKKLIERSEKHKSNNGDNRTVYYVAANNLFYKDKDLITNEGE